MGPADVFEIVFDNAEATFKEGDKITGHVRIANAQELKCRAIKLELYGVAVVYSEKLEEKKVLELNVDELKNTYSRVQCFRTVISLVQDDGLSENCPVLPTGEHEFTFSSKLPPELPSTFLGQYGQIYYVAEIVLQRPSWKSCVVSKKSFVVQTGLDLSFIPEAAARITVCKYREPGLCCLDGSVTVKWSVDRSGYVPGDSIIIKGTTQNDSKHFVHHAHTALFMVTEYKTGKKKKRERKQIAVANQDRYVVTEGTITWAEHLIVPPTSSTSLARCRLIDTSYELEFQAQIIGSYLSPIVVCKDVYIGTIPICFQEMESYMAGMYNHPYNATKYSKDGCIVRTNPSAPPSSITSSDLNEMASKVTSTTDLGGISNGGLRPPPFCPGFDQKSEVGGETAKPGFDGKPASIAQPD